MSVRFVRNRNNQIPPVQFQHSPEIGYWAKKHNLTPHELEEAFVECNFSMIKAIELCKNKISRN